MIKLSWNAIGGSEQWLSTNEVNQKFFLLVFYMNTYRNNKNLLFIKICVLILWHRVWNHVYCGNKYALWELLIDIALSLFLIHLHFCWWVSEIASDAFAAWYICIIGAHPLCVLEITDNKWSVNMFWDWNVMSFIYL
jgi:hypothetical protein